MHFSRQIGPLLTAVAVAFLAGCGSTSEPETENFILSEVSGNSQTANIEQTLAAPLVVQVMESGTAASGRTVTWSVTGGGGSLNPTTSTTDGAGRASTSWTLGASAGAQSARASSSGASGSPVSFTATAVDPSAPNEASVSVADNLYNPATRTVAVGGTVTWTWGGSNPHSVTFPSGSNSATQTSGTFARTFPTAGTFNYQCVVHGAAMSGTVIVQ